MRHEQQRGFSLPLAIFVITVLALVGTALVQLTRSGQEATSAEVLSIRAFYAAESGAQLGLQALFPLSGGSLGAAGCSSMNLTPAFNVQGLQGCSAIVTCLPRTIGTDIYYTINSTGICSFGNNANTARRSIELMAKSP